MTLEGIGEGVEGVIVDWDDGDRWGEAVGASLPSKDSDLKACVEEVGENSRAKIAGSLCEIWMLMSLQGHRRGRARGWWRC